MQELAKLTSTADPLIQLTQTHTEFRTDYAKFGDFITALQAQVTKHAAAQNEVKMDLQQKAAQLEAVQEEKQRLQVQ